MPGNALLILQQHDHWATRRVLEACAHLSRSEFLQRFEIGHGSLHDNLTHIIGAMRRWKDRVAGGEIRPSIERAPEAKERTPTRLLELFDEAAMDLDALVKQLTASGQLDKSIEFSFEAPGGNRTVLVTALEALVHVHTHGQHHRSQCFNMLRHLGYPSDSGDYDVIEWTVRRDPAAA